MVTSPRSAGGCAAIRGVRRRDGPTDDLDLPPAGLVQASSLKADGTDPKNTSLEPTESWIDWMRNGVWLVRNGRAEEAIAHLIRAAAERPADLRSREYLGKAFLDCGRHDDALKVFDQILYLRPQHRMAQHGRGLALYGLRDAEGALDTFRSATAGHPRAWRAWTSIADITPDEAERIDAIGRAAAALEAVCRKPGARTADFAECADALVNAKRFDDALAFIHSHFGQFPTASAAHDRLASAHYHDGAFLNAFNSKQDALATLDPGALPLPPQAKRRSAATAR